VVVVPDIDVTSERVVRATIPVALAFTPDGRLFYNELISGRIRVYDRGREYTFAQVNVFVCDEFGLLGLAVDPEFQENHYIYVYYIEPVADRDDIGHPVIVRFTDVDGEGQDPTVIVGDLPNTSAVCAHVGGNIHFGPDGYLYVSIGDMQLFNPHYAQDLGSPLGKILRIDKSDGSAALDNPFVDEPGADPRVFAYGLRNPFDFTFHPQSGKIYAPDNGLGNCDELNIIEAGNNYGHPEASFPEEDPPCLERAGVRPIYLYSKPDMRPEVFQSNVAPTGVHFVSADVYPSLGDALLSCEFNTGFMRRFLIAGPKLDHVADGSIAIQGCSLAMTTDPDGIVYYSGLREIRRLLPSSQPEE
jgi:glucose/arabinose dehydrogenase